MSPASETLQLSTGTSLRIVGLYAAYGLHLQKIGGVRQVRLTGLDEGVNYPYAKFETMHSELLRNLQPVLRPYAALGEPLADTSIPAVAVAQLLGDDCEAERRIFTYALVPEAGGPLTVEVRYRGGELRNRLQIFPNWDFAWLNARCDDDRMQNLLAAYDYLRANLFAVPVGGQQLVEGVDFVALEPGEKAVG